jgi:methyl-accepting chemotaxis protein
MRISLRLKLIFSFLIIAVISGGVSVMFYQSLTKVHHSYSDILERQVVLKEYADNLKYYASSQNNNLYSFLITQDRFSKSQFLNKNDLQSELLIKVKALLHDKSLEEQLDYTIKLNKQYRDKVEKVFETPKDQAAGAIKEATTGIIPLGEVIVKFAQQLADRQDQLMSDGKKANQKTVTDIQLLVLVMGVINFLLALSIGFIISRMISKPIGLLSNATKTISEGHLDIDNVHVKQRDELGNLALSFNQMAENLRILVRQINESTTEVMLNSGEVSAGSENAGHAAEHISDIMMNLSGSAENQEIHVEQCFKAINEMSTGIQQIDFNSQQSSITAEQALEMAFAGDREIGTVTIQMNAIHQLMIGLDIVMQSMHKRSNEIEEVNKGIAAIAQQTTVLALNAAIEAARAGAQGRAFAVVTDEIRKLSLQTNEAAKRVTQLASNIQSETSQAVESVKEISSEVSKGKDATHSVSQLFVKIKNHVSDTTIQIREVSESSHQLSTHSMEIVQSMEQIASLARTVASETQHVTSITEEQLASLQQNTAYANTLSFIAEKLQSSVHKFRL